MKKTNAKKSFSWLTLLGTFFALLICVTTSGMIYIVYPQSNQLLRVFFHQNSSEQPQLISQFNDSDMPTPFQPAPTEIFLPTNTPEIKPTEIPKPTPSPTKQSTKASENETGELPASSYISGIYGSTQLYTLDCEAQAAVDWADFFGVHINELELIDRIPKSDDPTQGFVGNINGSMGQLPPGDYGVYPGPIAAILREYGLNARAVKGWDIQSIKEEIAAGRPVIVWIVNLPFAVETSQYTASNGNTSIVARFEHTWIVTGYNASTFTVIDSEWTYNVKTATLVERWNALGNQAIIMNPD
ncbi:MAG: C39 family peptidase [Pelolinea sp.]|nr:C39 family peptidase [Pelolinea sp.]